MAKSQNKGFLLRLDPATMELVEKWAVQEFRSVNGQLQWIIADSLKRYGRMNRKMAESPAEDNQNESRQRSVIGKDPSLKD